MSASFSSTLQPPIWLQRIVLALIGLYPLISVAVNGGGSVVYALLVVPALFLAWSAYKELTHEERLWLAGYLVLFALALIGLTYTEDMHEGPPRLERYFRLATTGLVFLLLLRLRLETGRLFLLGIPLAIVAMTAQAVYEVHYLHAGLADGLYHKIIFGDLAVLWFLLLLTALLTVARKPWQWIVLSTAMLMAIYPAVMSKTRGSWLALLVVLGLLLWLHRERLSRRGWMLILGGVVALSMLLAIWQPRPLMNPMQSGIQEIQSYIKDPNCYTDGSWGPRLCMWRHSLIIWSEHPLFGAGLGDFLAESRVLVAEGVSKSAAVLKYGHAHSIFFDVLAGLGLVGLVALVTAIFVLPWRLFYRHYLEATEPWTRFYALGGLVTLSAFFVFGLTEAWTNRMPMVNPYIVCLVVFASSLAVRARENHAPGA